MVTAATANGTATAGNDFDITSGTLNFAGNANEIRTLTVPITDDSIVEDEENFTVSLSVLAGTTANVVITDTGTVTITDDDSAQLTVGNVTVDEDAGNAEVVVTLNNAVSGGFTVTASITNGTAIAGEDFGGTIGFLNFTGNEDEAVTFDVPITDDSIVEGSETFTVSLSNLAGATNVDITDTGTVTINDNDVAALTVENVTVDEDADTATVELTLNNAVTGRFTVTAATDNGTAIAGSDFESTSETLDFTGSASETRTLTVPITNDDIVEGSETFTVSLNGLGGTSLTVGITSIGTVTII